MGLLDDIRQRSHDLLTGVRNAPDDFVAALVGSEQVVRYPVLRTKLISVAMFAADGRSLYTSGAFAGSDAMLKINRDNVGAASNERSRVFIDVPGDDDPGSGYIVYGSRELAGQWLLPPDAQAALADRRADTAAISLHFGVLDAQLANACAAVGLTPLQARLTLAVIRHGSIKDAARAIDIAYASAREAVADALRRSGTSRLPDLIRLVTFLTVGMFPDETMSPDFARSAAGLTSRQLALAACIANGSTRLAAARATGVSEAVAKKEIDALHGVLGTNSAASVARRLTELTTLNMLTDVTVSDIAWGGDGLVPLTLTQRDDGSRIAFSDYGPRSGKPLFLLHSSMTTRPVARGLLTRLQSAGYRVIAMDRPGFGQSDMPVDGIPADPGYFAVAARDVVLLCHRLKLQQIDLVSRGAAQVVTALHRAAPGLLRHVVITNPDPATDLEGLRKGPLGVFKEAYYRRPALIGVIGRVLASQLTPERALSSILSSFDGSEIDCQTIKDPDHFADYYRSLRPFATGRVDGFAHEQAELVRNGRPDPIAGTHSWAVLLAQHDTLHDPGYVERYWRSILPDARFRTVAGSGRLMTMSHPDAVVAALAELASPT